ncbi:MAG TPA: dTMP kinase [Planctomycetota bacterium]|nr:dTMP kinase [Planctomycetota bacterium]
MPLIVLEGIDGSGKSTQVRLLGERLQRMGRPYRALREPGGTALGEQQRALLLDPATQACPTAELFGYLQARAQLCHEVVAPALARGELVVLDRFYHSTIAYQAYGLGLPHDAVRAAIRLAIGDIAPAVVLWIELDPAIAARRRASARGEDRIEARGLAYLKRVHDGFAALAAAGEMIALSGLSAPEDLARDIWTRVAPIVG